MGYPIPASLPLYSRYLLKKKILLPSPSLPTPAYPTPVFRLPKSWILAHYPGLQPPVNLLYGSFSKRVYINVITHGVYIHVLLKKKSPPVPFTHTSRLSNSRVPPP